MKWVATSIRSALASRDGNFAVAFALISTVLFGLVAGAVDMFTFSTQKSAIQESVDSGALAAVSEANLKGWDEKVAAAVAEDVARANYATNQGSDGYFTVKTSVDRKNRSVTVSIIQDHYPFFYSSMFPSPQITATATATAAGSTNVCVIGLNTTQSATVGLNDKSLLTAPNCAVYSNSTATDGLAAIKFSTLNAALACSAGGYLGAGTNFDNIPITDCPPIEDPLKHRPPPAYSTACTKTALTIEGEGVTATLSPGVYCNGLTFKSGSIITLKPGVYVIKDGPLTLGSNASMYGRGVGFYFVGDNATFSLESGSTVDIEAGKTGAMAGLLFHQDRSSTTANFLLRSNKASNLLGTIYLPNGNFIIDTAGKVADASAYTTIVAKSLTLIRQPNVVLNTNYDATDVPVPEGLGPTAGDVRLID